jgi:hypothetical protein
MTELKEEDNRSASGAVVGRSAAAPECFYANFLYQKLRFVLLFLNPSSNFRKHAPKALDLHLTESDENVKKMQESRNTSISNGD